MESKHTKPKTGKTTCGWAEAVRQDHDVPDGPGVALQHELAGAGRQVPDPPRVVARHRAATAVGQHGRGVDDARVALELAAPTPEHQGPRE